MGAGKAYRFPIDDLYIPLTTAGGERGTILLDQALVHPHLVIEGDPGAGKTTFLRRIAHGMCADPKLGFPIYLRVGDLEEHVTNCRKQVRPDAPPSDHSPEWLAHCAAHRCGLSVGFFQARLREKGTTVLLDGLDEASSSSVRDRMARLVQEAVVAYPRCRFVVTTRPQSYTGASRLAGFHEVRVLELEKPAISEFLGHWSRALFPGDAASAEAHRQALSDALNARPAIRKMARNPVMLTALAVVHWNERRLPEQREELYASITMWLVRAREARPGRETADRVLSLLGHLALGMQTRPEGRVTQVGKDAAAGMIAGQFREVADPDLQLARARAFLEAEEVDSGIFVSRGGELRFWHLTLQEYLAARTIAGLTDASQFQVLFQDERLYRPEWREAMLLLAGTLIGGGSERVDGLFAAMLRRVGVEAELAEKARCVGLVGAMLSDLRPYSYNLPGTRYEELLAEVLGIFDREKSRGIDLQVRLAAAEALGQAGDPRLLLPKDGEYWVRIPAGKFVMGEVEQENEPKHEVYLDSFLIGKYPVTVYEYGRFLDDTEHEAPPGWEEQRIHTNRPVVRVRWDDAVKYCEWAKTRLATEAEWERATRGPEGRRYAWGNDEPTAELANYRETKVNASSPVGVFPLGSTPAPEHIYDLTGNEWEWVADWYSESYYRKSPQKNPKGATRREYRALRGGSWSFDSSLLRAAVRNGLEPGGRDDITGFRCVREVVP